MVTAVPSVRRCVMQAAEDALTKKHSEPTIAAAVALAAVVSVESPFIHVTSMQVLIKAKPEVLLGCLMRKGHAHGVDRESKTQSMHKVSVMMLLTL